MVSLWIIHSDSDSVCICVYVCVCVSMLWIPRQRNDWSIILHSFLSLQVLHWVINSSSLLPFTLLFYVFYICVFIYVLAVTPVAFVITLGFFRPPEKASENRLSLSALLLPSFNLLLFLPRAGIFPSLSVLELAINKFSDLLVWLFFIGSHSRSPAPFLGEKNTVQRGQEEWTEETEQTGFAGFPHLVDED